MVESLKELNQICQKPHYKKVGNWMVRYFLRDAALPVTWLLLRTPVTANQVTLCSLILGLAGIICFAFLPVYFFLIGVLLLQIWYFLDHVDGQIARYRKTANLTGRFFDFLTHHIIHGTIFFSLGIYGFRATGVFFFVLLGFVSSFAIMLFNLIHDTKYKTFFEHALRFPLLRLKKIPAIETGKDEKKTTFNLYRFIFSCFHKLSEIHVLMNILTVAAFGQFFLKQAPDLRLGLLVVYSLITPALTVVKLSYLILYRKLDEEFHTVFDVSSFE